MSMTYAHHSSKYGTVYRCDKENSVVLDIHSYSAVCTEITSMFRRASV